jgi:hypothetical protein
MVRTNPFVIGLCVLMILLFAYCFWIAAAAH